MVTGLWLARCLVTVVCVLGYSVLHVSAATKTIRGITYTEVVSTLNWDDANTACVPNLAVFNDVDTYKEVIDWLRAFKADGYTAWIGAYTAQDEPEARWVNGRVLTMSNLWATAANLTERRCVKLQLDPDGEHFNYYSTWLMEECTEELPYICMNIEDEPCSAPEDLCNPGDTVPARSLNSYCVWEGPLNPVTKVDAVDYCEQNGGGLISIYTASDLTEFQTRFANTSFNKYQPWNAVWTALDQEPGEGHWRFPNGYIPSFHKFAPPSAFTYDLLNIQIQVAGSDVQYGSTLSASGWTVVYFPYFDAMALHNDAAWNLVDIFFIEYLTGGTRQPFNAYTVCEAHEDDFCLHNADKVPFAVVTLDTAADKLYYQCYENFTFEDGFTRKEHSCSCNLDELKNLDPMLKRGCTPKNLCADNPCDQTCVSSLSYARGYQCSCAYGYRLADDQHSCVDIDECKEQTDPCGLGENGACRNRPGTFDCFCYVGFSYSQTGQCEAYSPFTSGTIELSFRLPGCAGDYLDDETKQAIVAAIYDIAENHIFMSRVTVGEVTISPSGTLTVELTIGGVATLFDHSEIAFRYEQMLTGTGLPLPSGNCRVTAGVYYDSPLVSDSIQVIDSCSLYNAAHYCLEDSECDPLPEGPRCLCEDGYTGERCDTVIEVPEPPQLSTVEIALIIVVVILFVVLVVVIVMLYYLWTGHTHTPRYHPPVYNEPVYAQKIGPPMAAPRPFSRFRRAMAGHSFAAPPPPPLPGFHRPERRPHPLDLARRREEFRKGYPIG